MNKKVFSFAMVLMLAFSAIFTFSAQAGSESSTSTLVLKEGNTKCEDLNSYWFEIKFENPRPTSLTFGDVTIYLSKDIDSGTVTS